MSKVGYMGVMYVCLMGYSVMFTGYWALVDPWWAVALRLINGKLHDILYIQHLVVFLQQYYLYFSDLSSFSAELLFF